MSNDNDDATTGGRVFQFPRIGFTLTPTTGHPDPGPDSTPAPDGATRPDWDAVTVTGRRSPLDIAGGRPNPGLNQPMLPPAPMVSPAPGLPDTFRNPDDHPDMVGPRLGALSLAACLAVAVAALRGTATFLADRRQARLAAAEEAAPLREARLKHQLAMRQLGYDAQQAGAKHSLASTQAAGKHAAAMQGIGDKNAQQRAKNNSRVPSSQDFGRKSLGNRSNTGSGAGGAGKGSGTGQKGPAGKGPSTNAASTGTGPRGKNNPPNKPAPKPGADVKKNKKPDTPTNAKQTSTPASSPSLERARRRQDRTDNRQAGRLQRRADRQAARLNNQTKDRDAARNQKTAAADARRAAKDKVRGDRIQAREARREQKADTKQQKKQDAALAKDSRTTLPKAIAKEARRRLKKRRKNLAPPILTKTPKQKKTKKNGKGNPGAAAAGANTPKVNLKKPKSPGHTPGSTPKGAQAGQQGAGWRQRGWWAKAQAHARKGATPGPQQGGPQNAPGAPGGTGGAGAQQPGPGAPGGQQSGPGQRKSPFQNAGQAAQTPPAYTVTSDHVPGSKAKRWEPDAVTTGAPALPATGPAALDAAPVKTFPRPGTTRPKEARPMPPASGKSDPRLVKARKQAARTGHIVTAQARHMDPMHETEITLDDAIDEYGDFKDDAFKTHDQCARLAGRAIKLRDTLALFALELATKHNLIGALFTGAMARLSESMDLLARMAEEMQVSSLEAAEMSEAADNDLNDAYRPYNVATADAGLSTPSAPIHNET